MKHYHLATVVKFKANKINVNRAKNLFGCLYEINIDNQIGDPMEKLLILLVDKDYEDDGLNNYIITDFLYKEKGADLIRCRVLCPVVETKHHIIGDDNSPNIHWLEVTEYNGPLTFLTPSRTCSAKNYAYRNINGQELFLAFKISDENYVPMYCFSDKASTLLNSYLAFCKVDDLTKVGKEWVHADPLSYETDKNGYEFLCHKKAHPY